MQYLPDRYLAPQPRPPTAVFLLEPTHLTIPNPTRLSKVVLLISAFQSHTPTRLQVIGKARITCRVLSNNISNSLDTKALGTHGICRVILTTAPQVQLPAALRLHSPWATPTPATSRITRCQGLITGLSGVYRRSSSSNKEVTRCRVHEGDLACDWLAGLRKRVSPLVMRVAFSLSAPNIPVHSSYPAPVHALLHNTRNPPRSSIMTCRYLKLSLRTSRKLGGHGMLIPFASKAIDWP
jgi:hypothetical protein